MCRLCDVDVETQHHIMNCEVVRGTDRTIAVEPYMSDNVPLDHKDELQELKDRYDKFRELVSNRQQKEPPINLS